MVFTLIIPRRPPSGNKGPNRKFQETVRAAAAAQLGAAPKLEGNLYCRIVWFHAGNTKQDVDNIGKNILDALKGTVFEDDVTVVRCLTTRVDTRKPYDLDKREEHRQNVEALQSLIDKEKHVLYIEIGIVKDTDVSLGEVH